MALNIIPTKYNQLRKGDYIVINDNPCEILDIHKSCTRKIESVIVYIALFDLVTQQKNEFLILNTKDVNKIKVIKEEYQIVDIDYKFNIINCANKNDELCGYFPITDNLLFDEISNAFKNKKNKDVYFTLVSVLDLTLIKNIKIK